MHYRLLLAIAEEHRPWERLLVDRGSLNCSMEALPPWLIRSGRCCICTGGWMQPQTGATINAGRAKRQASDGILRRYYCLGICDIRGYHAQLQY